LIGDQAKQEIGADLNGGDIGWNDTIIVLIPKVRRPTKLKRSQERRNKGSPCSGKKEQG
jgi:hypothetical protein